MEPTIQQKSRTIENSQITKQKIQRLLETFKQQISLEPHGLTIDTFLLISETVFGGSVHLILKNNNEGDIIRPHDLLEWLALSYIEVNEKTFIAYYLLLRFYPQLDHYLNNKKHFIYLKPRYLHIYKHYGRNLEEYVYRPSGKENFNIYLKNGIDTPIYWREDQTFLSLISGKIKLPMHQDLYWYLMARNKCRLHHNPMTTSILLKCDWLDRIEKTKEIYPLVIKRINNLKINFNTYYHIISKYYQDLILKLYQSHKLTHLTKNEFYYIHQLFPNLFEEKIFSFSNIGFYLSVMDPEIAAYLLGYPIENGIPDDNSLKKAILFFEQQGPDSFCNYIKQSINSYFQNKTWLLSHFETEKDIIVNRQNLLTENINDYLPFDIHIYRENEYLYFFTREEFESIFKSGKNPYNRRDISSFTPQILKTKIGIESKIKLPPAEPLKNLLIRLENGIDALFQIIDKKVSNDNNSNSRNLDDELNTNIHNFFHNQNEIQSNYNVDGVITSNEERTNIEDETEDEEDLEEFVRVHFRNSNDRNQTILSADQIRIINEQIRITNEETQDNINRGASLEGFAREQYFNRMRESQNPPQSSSTREPVITDLRTNPLIIPSLGNHRGITVRTRIDADSSLGSGVVDRVDILSQDQGQNNNNNETSNEDRNQEENNNEINNVNSESENEDENNEIGDYYSRFGFQPFY